MQAQEQPAGSLFTVGELAAALDDIATVLGDDSPGRQATRELAQRHTAEIDAQIARLRLARDMMGAAGACTCPTVERCGCGVMDPVIRRLRRHLGS